MNSLIQPLVELKEYNDMIKALEKGKTPLLATGVFDSQKIHLIHGLLTHQEKKSVILTSSEMKAKEIYEDLSFFVKDNRYLYPSKDIIFYNADVHSLDIIEQRISVLKAIIEDQPSVIVLSIEALLDRLVPLKRFKKFVIRKEVGDVIDLEEFKKQLIYMGYERVDIVESKGQFSLRGGIIDVYPITSEFAYRIELWDDEIDSIRFMDATSQRSVDKAESIEIYPAVELVIDEDKISEAIRGIDQECHDMVTTFKRRKAKEEIERITEISNGIKEQLSEQKMFKGLESYISFFYKDTVTLLDYLEDDTMIFLDESVRSAEKLKNAYLEFQESIKSRLEKGYLLKSQADMIFTNEDIIYQITHRQSILLNTLPQQISSFSPAKIVSFHVKSINPFHQKLDILQKEIENWVSNNYRVLLLAGSKTRAERLVEELRDRDIRAIFSSKLINPIISGEVVVANGSLHKGFEYPTLKYVVISESEVFGKAKPKKKRKKAKGSRINSFSDLNIGDYVVHENHGVGIYRGIEQINVDNVSKDYLKISYKDGGNLYIPTSQLDLLQKYIGGENRKPKLNKLGGTEWQKTKTKVRKAVQDLAEDLVKLYAQREQKKGHQYTEDTVWQREFEEMFPYDETDDQLESIEDVKRDMESTKIMDRLLCGDVGYGKTEVAIRGAFKAVQDGKQVAYLVPTTILAQQHFNNFVERMKDFPVNIELLSRFRTPKEIRTALENTRKGMVDILIGTHRLLSKDVNFKDLGLLIIDEEQRFGVAHKEKIKHIKENVDVLTLTATPIPRTLHMSLIGIRDMSVLEEPPHERHPVQTYVLEENPELIKDAIYRELSRGGQVYYVYNRVKNIDMVTETLRKMVPEARIAYAHGQMSERQLEEIMVEFIGGEIDILVSTTIIETGLDIANSNTMIIQDADHMGLSQLYQLRGRVGRSNRIAYAYLLYKKDKILQQSAEKRLQAIREFTEFGSGFKIAMRDLEIRGAGNLLGAQQHGHMDAVGYDMYCKLLEEAICDVRDEPTKDNFETTITIDVDAYIPRSYIESELQKLEIYKKIASIENEKDFYDVQEELEDRFGDLARSVNNLLEISLVKAMANDAQIQAVEQKGDKVVFIYKNNAKVDGSKVPDLMKKHRNRLLLASGETPKFTYKLDVNSRKDLLTNIKNMLHDLKSLKLQSE
ncbi:transcription-repair coupling factor [Vallitalea okinawensis]|uniref:transcription-repair coupling factor n=1 Tax=Vallitalea okinawensis TaxID=2078660 RepID=UPI000CFC34FA|nr:transcription-repair coupling factor [Vallitalea okinawensis]